MDNIGDFVWKQIKELSTVHFALEAVVDPINHQGTARFVCYIVNAKKFQLLQGFAPERRLFVVRMCVCFFLYVCVFALFFMLFFIETTFKVINITCVLSFTRCILFDCPIQGQTAIILKLILKNCNLSMISRVLLPYSGLGCFRHGVVVMKPTRGWGSQHSHKPLPRLGSSRVSTPGKLDSLDAFN